MTPPKPERLCVLCNRHRAQVGDACRTCFLAILPERAGARRDARRKAANGEAG